MDMPNINLKWLTARKPIYHWLSYSPLAALVGLTRRYRWAERVLMETYEFWPTERVIEYAFVHEQIPLGGQGKILDVGCGSSLLPLELASKGYQVWGLDSRQNMIRSWVNHFNLRYTLGDIRKAPFEDDFFDYVTAVSSIEHVGLPDDPQGDKVALQEIRRILKGNGKLILTVPFGQNGVYAYKGIPLWRVYAYTTLMELLCLFGAIDIQYAMLSSHSWRPATLKEVEGVDSLSQPVWKSSLAIAMVVCSAPRQTEL